MKQLSHGSLLAVGSICIASLLPAASGCFLNSDKGDSYDPYDGGGGSGAGSVGCGDGTIGGSEQCDDGNTLNGDCCSATCQYEAAGSSCDDQLCSNGDAAGSCDGAGTCTGGPDSQTGQCIVFLSSGSYYGDEIGGLAGADAICQQLANEAGLGGTYMAWLSDSHTSAASRLAHSIVPYVRLDGAVVAQDWQDLTDGSGLSHAISVDEDNYDWYGVCAQCYLIPGGCGAVWTGTAPNGSQDRGTCSDWTTQEATGGDGVYCQEMDTSWTEYPPGLGLSVDCHHARSLYCFQQ